MSLDPELVPYGDEPWLKEVTTLPKYRHLGLILLVTALITKHES